MPSERSKACPIRKSEQGQAVLPVLAAASVLLMGAAGFAVDLSNLYFQRQMAQAAADAAAQAAMMSIFDGTNTAGAAAFSTGGSFTCGASDARTPCQYAQWNGFGTSADTVTVSFPSSIAGVSSAKLSPSDPVNLVHVVVQRTVSTTLLKLLGSASSTAGAAATAAIVTVTSPSPILVTDPNNDSGTFNCGGNCSITICGGPSRGIQVNSSSPAAISIGGSASVDLSKAGPNDPGNCTTGTGADFGAWGGPASAPGGLNLGSTGQYVQPASPVQDPLAGVSPPPVPTVTDPPKTSLAVGGGGCPASASEGCTLYSPGLYTSGIQVKQTMALFKPGIYYIQNGGFSIGALGDMEMATGYTDDSSGTNTGWTGNMLVYSAGKFDLAAANSTANLVGSPIGSAYQGILFFEDRSAASQTHSLGGGGGISLKGTIYLTNSLAKMTGSSPQLQTLNLGGNSGSSTLIQGEIVVSWLNVGGTGGVQMDLTTNAVQIRQVALVQ